MSIAELLVPEFDMECATTRKVLERVPEDRIEWKPHEKAFPMGHLAQLVARLPGWAEFVVSRSEFDIAPKDKPPGSGYTFEKVATLLELFDTNVAKARRLIAGASDEAMRESWTMKARGEPVLTMPRYMILRTQLLNHLVHHRAQLGLYLRLTDQKVPSMYGPTADDRQTPAG